MADDINQDDLSDLSPQKILQRRAAAVTPPTTVSPMGSAGVVVPPPAPLGAPTPDVVPPPIQPLTHEELLRQAAEAPNSSFILPQAEMLGGQVQPELRPQAPVEVQPPQPLPMPQQVPAAAPPVQVVPPMPQQVITPQAPSTPTPLQPEVQQQSIPLPVPEKVQPPVAPAQTPVPPPSPFAKKPTAMPVPAAVPPKAQPTPPAFSGQPKKKPVAAIGIGLLVVLIVLAGGSYAAAATRGTRVPFLYTAVSGLPTTGTAVNTKAQEVLARVSSYQVSGSVSLSQGATEAPASAAPSLPGDDFDFSEPVSTESAGAVISLKSEFSAAEFSNKGQAFLSRGKVTVNSNSAIEVALQTGATGSADSIVAFFPKSETAVPVSVVSDQIHKTLLYPVVSPIPLEALLSSVQTELQYGHFKNGNSKQAAYAFSVKDGSLASYLPAESTLDNAVLTVRYGWKESTAVPQRYQVKGTLTYLGQKYAYDYEATLASYNKDLDISADEVLSQLQKTAKVAKIPDTFIKEFGILSPAALPNTLSADLLGQEESSALTPTGKMVTSVGSPITIQPAKPASPPSDEAKVRDVQRRADLALMKQALELYHATKGSYPQVSGVEQTGASATLFNELVPAYLTAMPVDPLDSTYWYEYASIGTGYALRSVAEDSTNASAKQGAVYPYFEITN